VLDQRRDRLVRQGPTEELRLGVEVARRRWPLRTRPLGPILDRSEVSLGRPVRQVTARRFHRVGAHPADQLAEQLGGVGLAVEHAADRLDPRQPLAVAGGGQAQGGVELLGRVGGEGLPGPDHRSRRGRRPDQVEDRGRRRGEGAEHQRGDHAEVAAAGAAQRPEQLPIVLLVTVDDAAVRQDDPRPEQVVAGQAVLAAEDPQPAAEREAGDPDRGTAAGRDGQPMLGQRIVELAEPHAGTDGGHLPRDRHRTHGRDVQNDPSVEERPATECPPLRIAVGRRSPRATARVAATSVGVAHRTTAAGRRCSKRAITGLRTDS
jgi:hypothetical protein